MHALTHARRHTTRVGRMENSSPPRPRESGDRQAGRESKPEVMADEIRAHTPKQERPAVALA